MGVKVMETVISVHTKDVLSSHIDVHRDLRSHASEKEAREHLEYLKKEGLFDENLDAYAWHFVSELKEAVKEESNTNIVIKISWGFDGDKNPSEYSFKTQAEADAFMRGVEESNGWFLYEVVD